MLRMFALFLVIAPPASAAMMSGQLGPYSMTREASGTSWQPDSTPHEGIHLHRGDWMWMTHGYLDLAYDRQGGPRGGEKNFAAGMLMLMGRRELGPGALGLRGMLSFDPVMGPSGYPLLLQTGETADGRVQLTDRQHPHDFFMELAGTYSVNVGDDASVFVYAGLPGEPALGPSAFMHRLSGAENPEAPISHHWLDSTHIAEGVATAGVTRGAWKLEGSAFRGREPDQYRWDIEKANLDSHSGRVSFNPGRDWSLQVSYGRIHSPEALMPATNQSRFTASASVNTHFWRGLQQTTFAYGRAENTPGKILDAYLLESTARFADRHTVFGRIERVDKDELFAEGDPLEGSEFAVGKATLGYRYDFARWKRTVWGVGGAASVYALPAAIRPAYGRAPVSYLLFVRAKLS